MIDLHPAAAELARLLDGVRDDQLTGPTPCVGFCVGDLVDHVDKSARGLATVAGAPPIGPDDTGDPGDAANLGQDWRASTAAHAHALATAWSDPEAWDGSTPVSEDRELPNQTWGLIALTELVVHGWDLARATGQALSLPDDVLHAGLDHVVAFVPAAPVPELWGEPAALPDAPTADRIAAASGRDPAWHR